MALHFLVYNFTRIFRDFLPEDVEMDSREVYDTEAFPKKSQGKNGAEKKTRGMGW